MTEPNDTAPSTAVAVSMTVEAWVHIGVLVAILVPLLLIVFPAMVIVFAVAMLSSSIAAAPIAEALSANTSTLIVTATVFCAIIALAAAGVSWRAEVQAKAVRGLSGADGDHLRAVVMEIWNTLPRSTAAEPDIRWFPALDIAAYAVQYGTQTEVHVSAGLWRAAVAEEPIARAILAHELAHLIHRDPITFRALRGIVAAARAVLIAVAALGLLTLLYVLVGDSLRLLAAGTSWTTLVGRILMVLIAAAIIFVLLPLSWIAIRRQVAFVYSLLEVRADVSSALWTDGLERFTQAFASSSKIARSDRRDIVTAILSPHLTHLPERERLALIASPAAIVTPKLRFFALSLVLGVLLPINFGTAYIWGGGANHFVILGLVAALNLSIVAMLVAGQSDGPIQIDRRHLAALGIASVVTSALPSFNLEPISYLFFSWLAGFGGAPADWSALPDSVAITVSDLAEKFAASFLQIGSIVSCLIAFLSIFGLHRTTGWGSPNGRVGRIAVVGSAAIVGTVLAGFDDFRTGDYFPWTVVETLVTDDPTVRAYWRCAPLAFAFLADLLWITMEAAIGPRRYQKPDGLR